MYTIDSTMIILIMKLTNAAEELTLLTPRRISSRAGPRLLNYYFVFLFFFFFFIFNFIYIFSVKKLINKAPPSSSSSSSWQQDNSPRNGNVFRYWIMADDELDSIQSRNIQACFTFIEYLILSIIISLFLGEKHEVMVSNHLLPLLVTTPCFLS